MERVDINNEIHSHKPKRFVFGLMVIVFGVLLMMRNLNVLNPFWTDVIFSWEMLLIAIGFINVFNKDSLFGFIIMIVGAFFLLNHFFELPWNVKSIFWPTILIIIGISLLFKGNRKLSCRGSKCNSGANSSDDFFQDIAVFGGSERHIISKEFKGGKSIAVFGGSSFDMSKSELSDGKNLIEAIMIFGGTKFVVPSNWNIKIEIVSVFGGFEDKRVINNSSSADAKWITIKGIAVFGGGEIKSY